MELEKQVVSLELAKQLNRLEIKQESLFYWEKIEGVDNYSLVISDSFGSDVESLYHPCYSAFTVAELGEMLAGFYLPVKPDRNLGKGIWLYVEPDTSNRVWVETEVEARARMLIYLAKNCLLDTHA